MLCVLGGAYVFLLPFMSTWDDMGARLDELGVPADFEWIAQGFRGSRPGFWGGNPPRLVRMYAAEWDAGNLCDRLGDWARSLGPTEELHPPRPAGRPSSPTGRLLERGLARPQPGCVHETSISSGWSAKLANVWSYKLHVGAAPPQEVMERQRSYGQCQEHRDAVAGTTGELWFRRPPCWVPPGQAMVEIALTSKSGF